jgi:hypothetical protein
MDRAAQPTEMWSYHEPSFDPARAAASAIGVDKLQGPVLGRAAVRRIGDMSARSANTTVSISCAGPSSPLALSSPGLVPIAKGPYSVEVPCASASSSVGSLPLARRRWLAMTDSATSTILRLVRRA